jgi:hypothetical protein
MATSVTLELWRQPDSCSHWLVLIISREVELDEP